VISVNGDNTVRINSQTASSSIIRIIPWFVRGGKDLGFEQAAAVIDIVRGVGLDRIALMTQ
jgi:biopolymer transport protein ExbD